MIVRNNTVHQLQNSCPLNAKATPLATQLKLTTLIQLVIMVKLWLTIIVYTFPSSGKTLPVVWVVLRVKEKTIIPREKRKSRTTMDAKLQMGHMANSKWFQVHTKEPIGLFTKRM